MNLWSIKYNALSFQSTFLSVWSVPLNSLLTEMIQTFKVLFIQEFDQPFDYRRKIC